MNLIDIIGLSVLAISMIYGAYRGFLGSVMSLACFAISLLIAFIFGPVLGNALIANEGILDTVSTYTVSVVIPPANAGAVYEEDYVLSTVDSLPLPDGLKISLRQSLTEKRAASAGMETNQLNSSLRSEAGRAVARIVIGALSYVLCFLLSCIAFSILISLIRHVAKLPILKQFDWLAGLALGFIRGCIILMVVFLLLPVAASMSPVDGMNELISNSFMAGLFGSDGFFVGVVKGVLS
ncbi:MAG: hypothetical protein CW338_00050 [Clostridiales bacterium]|nr:hypothetical protein [Clostridiales bacterium]